jgi:hypothetical protein
MMTLYAETSNHELNCKCWRCYSGTLGKWLDTLGSQTEAGEWELFLTLSYRAGTGWGNGDKPVPDFGHFCFKSFVSELSVELGSRVEYVLADQRSELRGRFHQHSLLAARGLDAYPRRELENWWRVRAGWSRVLPFQQGAAYYLARYIGRNLETADWKVEVGNPIAPAQHEIGRKVIATSTAIPSELFHQTFPRRKK